VKLVSEALLPPRQRSLALVQWVSKPKAQRLGGGGVLADDCAERDARDRRRQRCCRCSSLTETAPPSLSPQGGASAPWVNIDTLGPGGRPGPSRCSTSLAGGLSVRWSTDAREDLAGGARL